MLQRYIKVHQLLWLFFSIIIVFSIYLHFGVSNDTFFFLSNFLVLATSLMGMATNPGRYYSLVKVVFVFYFFFFGVVPLNDMAMGNNYWGGEKIDKFYYSITNVVLFLGLISFYFGTFLPIKLKSNFSLFYTHVSRLNFFTVGGLFLFFVFVSIIILRAENFNIYDLFFRGLQFDSENLNDSSGVKVGWYFYTYFIRPIPIIFLFIFINYFKDKLADIRYRFFFLFFLVSSVALVAPTSVARFFAATLYIPFVIIFTGFLNKPYRLQLSFIFGLLVVLPFLDKFRKFNPDEFVLSINLNFLNHGHFAAYQNFVRVVELDIITHGKQLLGTILFFVPRSYWSAKPTGSAALLAEKAGYDFSNISLPYVAEGYINFGMLGVIMFMFLLGIILNSLDKKFWENKYSYKSNLFGVFYLFLLGFVFFIMRGDLMSSFAYFCAFSMSFLFVALNFKIIIEICSFRYINGKKRLK